MPVSAILFGSIGAVMETSDIQRRAYNAALHEAGLPWTWDVPTYAELLQQSGGKERLAMLAAATATALPDERVEIIHRRKTALACEEMVRARVRPRPGVAELVAHAKSAGLKLAFVTTTYEPNIDAVFAAAGDALARDAFDCVVSRADVRAGKPAPDAYLVALERLGIAAADALAIEDTATSVMAAKRAGITVVATPGALTAGQDFWQADLVVDALGDEGAIEPRVLALLHGA